LEDSNFTSLPEVAHEGFVTVSVDDGHPSDLRAAELLASLEYSATFYVPARNPEREVMSVAGIQRLAEAFEVGGHTYNHLALPALDHDTARREINDGKAWLEDAISAPVESFCYPRGKFNRRILDLVIEAGFKGARTTMGNTVAKPANNFLCGATTQAFSHSRLIQTRHAVIEGNWIGLANYARIIRFATDWTEHFERGLSYVSNRGGVAHLWFHSWELDKYDQWSQLEELLRRLRSEYPFRCATNGELFALYSGCRSQVPDSDDRLVRSAA
jgi:peptidoglycan/xylan/chitin deacetylase (PgdA/CDA1 family)